MDRKHIAAVMWLLMIVQSSNIVVHSLSAASRTPTRRCATDARAVGSFSTRMSSVARRPRRPTRLDMALDVTMRPIEDEKRRKNDDGGERKRAVGRNMPSFLRSTSTSDVSPRSRIPRRWSRRPNARENPNVTTVTTVEEYKSAVADERDKVVVVRFHAAWCKSCKAAHPLYKRLISKYGGPSGPIKFVDAPLTENTAHLHSGLGVPTVPFGHVYHPDAGLVEERKLNRRAFSDFESSVESYIRGSCDLPEEKEGGEDSGKDGDTEKRAVIAAGVEASFQ